LTHVRTVPLSPPIAATALSFAVVVPGRPRRPADLRDGDRARLAARHEEPMAHSHPHPGVVTVW